MLLELSNAPWVQPEAGFHSCVLHWGACFKQTLTAACTREGRLRNGRLNTAPSSAKVHLLTAACPSKACTAGCSDVRMLVRLTLKAT